mmetsp:Transcript_1252/g.5589  ORF Transcript_1252/g.5589 Transcript_1252/m.5589 type:complete len:251 (+) Transcript_1252:1024-1776(+)
MVSPTHLVCECSDAATASATFEDDAPDSASCRLRTNQSRYSIGKLMNVPPIKMYSTLSTEWPRRLSWSTLPRACTYGSYLARIARMLVGSYPVYDCVEYSKSESGPPGQYTQMLPVVAMWGHRWGLDMTATTAMPDAVRTGLARSCGNNASRCSSGTAPMSSTSFGERFRPYRRAASFFVELRLITLPSRTASIMVRTTSAMARTLASSCDMAMAPMRADVPRACGRAVDSTRVRGRSESSLESSWKTST